MGRFDNNVVTEPFLTKEYLYHGIPKEAFKIYMSSDLVDAAEVFCDIFWRTELPDPNPTCDVHKHPVPQLLMFAGADDSFEVVVPLDGDEYVITKSAAIWIPAGVEHSVFYRRIAMPMMETGILMQGEYA